ncbi:unnamed protein product [Prunus armeniaca]
MVQLIHRPLHQYNFELVTPGRKIPEWFSNQSVGDSLIVELPPEWMGIVVCVVFEDQADEANLADLSKFGAFEYDYDSPGQICFKIRNAVSNHLWVFYVHGNKRGWMKECSQTKILFKTYYSKQGMQSYHSRTVSLQPYCSSIKCGFRLVHEQDVEQLNQIMMNKSIIKSTTTCPTKSADEQGQQRHDDEEASPSRSSALTKNLSSAIPMLFPKRQTKMN